MGGYVGFRDGPRLVAMGGERLRPPGCAEVSGICTHPDARGRGLAEAVVRSVARGIQARGDLPFLHVAVGSPSEATAAALYERIGFRERARKRLEIARRVP
jgi:predicted GNAT family acetyltransferase